MRTAVGTLAVVLLAGCNASETDTEIAESGKATEAVTEVASEKESAKDGGDTAAHGEAEASKPQVACSKEETAIFSCKAGNGKTIAVCAAQVGKVEYRYGKGEAELVAPATGFASVPYSGGGEAQIEAKNGDTSYIVFSRVVRTNFTEGEPNYPEFTDGVIVQRGDQVLNLQVCDDPDAKAVDYDAAERFLTTADDLFTEKTDRASAE